MSRVLRPLITVSGFCSGVGKTSLVEFLIRRLQPIAALKVTVVDSGAAGCPITRACGVCEALHAPYRIITERRRIDVPQKDTGRYAAAGAIPVVWIQTRGECIDEALEAGLAAAALFGPRGLVVEGNTPVPRLHPDLTIMVDRAERRETKPSAAAILDRMELAVLNRTTGDSARTVALARDRLTRDLPGVSLFEIDLRTPAADGERLVMSVNRRLNNGQGWPEGVVLE